MGTSSSHRSPATPEWERVRELYRRRDPDPGHIASSIVSALDADTRSQMAGPGVALCLSTLLRTSHDLSEQGLAGFTAASAPLAAPPLLGLAQRLREQAELRLTDRDLASRFADIGLNALGTTVLEVGAGGAAGAFHVTDSQAADNLGAYAGQQHLGDLARYFLVHDFDHLFRYFVTRDLSDFIGSDSLPTVSDGSRLRDAITSHCRDVAGRVPAQMFEGSLARAVVAEDDAGLQQMGDVWSELMNSGLQLVVIGS
jgi:hypothetical protein